MVQEQEAPAVAEKMEESPVKTAATAESSAAEAPQSPTAQQEPQTSSNDREESIKKAVNALFQGKRHLLMKDHVHACSALGEACRLFSEVYGPLASEHAEAHFFYGKALLDQARADLAVFEAPPGVDAKSDEDTEESGDDEEEDDEDDEENKEKKSSDEEVKAGEGEEKKENESSTDLPNNSTLGEEDLNVPSPMEAETNETTAQDDEKPSTSKGVTEEQPADSADPGDELSSLELAWEVFEIAKLGYCKQIDNTETKIKAEDVEDKKQELQKTVKLLKQRLAETNSLLGEVGTESENYPQAIDDFKTALDMYTELESPDSREIAQVHFHIGVAHGLAKSFPDSIDSFRKSVEIIRNRAQNLKKSLEDNTVAEDSKTSAESEIKELEELLPELEERINDTLEQEKEAAKTAEEEKMEEEIIQRNSPVKNPNPPAANDISHLVKKRKKVEEPVPEATEQPEPPMKKACTNLNFEKNGKSEETPSPATNGHSNKEDPKPTATAAASE